MSKKAFIIPAYNPDEHLIDTVNRLQEKSTNLIFILNDGSDANSDIIFETLQNRTSYPHVILLEHSVNMGKGAALKTLFNYILVHHKEIDGVVSLDSDGQHSVTDCLAVLDQLETHEFVLGYRTFSQDIPLKSYIGNNISKFIYKIILGKSFKDTQTGLRGLNQSFMKQCLNIKSNRFEFETEQLALAVKENIKISEIPIETIYIESNKASSFRPLVDSFKIYFVLFRYTLSSVLTALVDFIIFMLSLSLGSSIMTANLIARTVSIGVQFVLLDKFVFYTNARLKNFILFSAYVYMMGIVSSVLQVEAVASLSISTTLAKISIEGLLFFINFAILKLYIFTKNRD